MAGKVIFQDFAGSKIWNHFKRSVCEKLAECNSCKRYLNAKGDQQRGCTIILNHITKLNS